MIHTFLNSKHQQGIGVIAVVWFYLVFKEKAMPINTLFRYIVLWIIKKN